jgi:hypothetical protein
MSFVVDMGLTVDSNSEKGWAADTGFIHNLKSIQADFVAGASGQFA